MVGTVYVGDPTTNGVLLTVSGVFIATSGTPGTATIQYTRKNGSNTEYLQADLVTFSTTPASIACTASAATGFAHVLTPPASALNFVLSWVITHSLYGIIGSDSDFVKQSPTAEDGDLDMVLVPT